MRESTRHKTDSSVLALFIKNFFMLFAFRGFGVLANLVVTILAGRTLSVELMSEYNLVFSLSNLLVIPLVMGANSTLLKILPESSAEERKELLGTVLIGNIAICLSFCLIGYLVTPLICRLPNLTPGSWYLAIALAVVTNSCILADTVLKADEKFLRLGLAKVAGSVFLFGSYVICILGFKSGSLYKYVTFNVCGQVIVLLVSVYRIGAIRLRFRTDLVRKLLSTSVMYMLSWFLITALNSADICIISAMRSKYDSGIFSTYQAGIRNYFSIFYNDIFATVMLPILINRGIDSKRLARTVTKFLPVVFLVLAAGTSVLLLLLLFAFGKKYPVVWIYVALEAAGIAFQGIYYFFNSLLVTEGHVGAKTSFTILAKPFLFLIATIYVCTRFFGITGTFVSFTINQAILAFLLLLRYRRTMRYM